MSTSEYKMNKEVNPLFILINNLIKYIDLLAAFVVISSITVMFLSLFSNVILRYTLSQSIDWAYEVPSILFPWMVAGGIVMAAARGKDISVTVLTDMLYGKLHKFLMILIHLIIGIISITVMISGERILMASKFQRLPETGIQQIWGYSSIYFAFSLVFILCLLHILSILFINTDTETSEEYTSFS
ncbi:TRAP transporter small permease [Arcobacter sp.]|uniref:TRAP transporter small permease n=1 Tax=Arcobacter sp. TaxID=1872629 RepID=UPI003C7382D9